MFIHVCVGSKDFKTIFLLLIFQAVVNRSSSDLAIEAQMIMDKTTHVSMIKAGGY